MVYNNYMTTYDQFLAFVNKLKTHQRHLHFLIIEIHKSKNKLDPSFMSKTYTEKNIPHWRRSGIPPSIPNINTQKYEFIRF